MSISHIILACLLFSPSPAWAGGDALEEARKLARSEDPRDREKAARRAAERADVAAARLLLELAGDEHLGVRYEAIGALRRLADPAGRALTCRAATRGASASQRAGACEAAGAYAHAVRWPALKAALRDRDPDVRAAAARALAEAAQPDGGVADALRPRLKDRYPAVRCAVIETLAVVDPDGCVADADGLARDHSEAVRVARLLALAASGRQDAARSAAIVGLSDRAWPVRAAAMDCLARCGNTTTAAPLVAALRAAAGRLRRDCTRALQRLTGKDIGPDPDLWDAWLAAKWGSRNGGGMRNRPRRAPETAATFYDIPLESDRVCFILDLSKSMGDAPKPGAPPRIETARNEIARVVRKLPLGSRVNAISFGKSVEAFRPRAFGASPGARAALVRWIQKRPIGGPTVIYDSLALALDDPSIDSIFLLTDGGASAGAFTDNRDILGHVARLNRYRRVAINCVAVGRTRRGRTLLRKLAAQNWGTYVEK